MENTHPSPSQGIRIEPTRLGHRQVVTDYTPCPDRPGFTIVPSASDNPSLARQLNGFDPHVATPTKIVDESGGVTGWVMPDGSRAKINPDKPGEPPPWPPVDVAKPPSSVPPRRAPMPQPPASPPEEPTMVPRPAPAEPEPPSGPQGTGLPMGLIPVTPYPDIEAAEAVGVFQHAGLMRRELPQPVSVAPEPAVTIPAEPAAVVSFHVAGFGAIPSRYHQVIHNEKSGIFVLIWDRRCKQTPPPRLAITKGDDLLSLSIGDSDLVLRCKNLGQQFTLGHLDISVLVVWDTGVGGENE